MKNKRFMLALVLLAALMTLFIGTALADQPTSGSCGPNLQWNLDRTAGVLTISGTGPMEDYAYSAVWYWTENRRLRSDRRGGGGLHHPGDNRLCPAAQPD